MDCRGSQALCLDETDAFLDESREIMDERIRLLQDENADRRMDAHCRLGAMAHLGLALDELGISCG